MDVTIYDDLVSSELLKKLYDWAKTKTYYVGYRGVMHDFDLTKNNIHTDTFAQHGIYRHPLGNTVEQVEKRFPEAIELWNIINKEIFNNKASFKDGIPEDHYYYGFNGHLTQDGLSFYEKYDVEPVENDAFTCYINGRCPTVVNATSLADDSGGIHKDCIPSLYGHKGYYTVLCALNPNWKPSYAGEILYFDPDEKGMEHPKRGYDVGWPKMCYGNKPGSIVVYDANTIHKTFPPNAIAPEFALRIAFRVKVAD
jgi:hypothetical protein